MSDELERILKEAIILVFSQHLVAGVEQIT
jgi:hypothetical protein